MATYKYYQPNMVVFREGYHNHEGKDWKETGGKYELESFLAPEGDMPDKDDHALYYLDTTLDNTGDGRQDMITADTQVVVLYKGSKPVTVDYKYVANAPRIAVEDYGLNFGNFFDEHIREEED